MEIIYGMGFIFACIFVYYTLRSLITGEPGPFETITYDDDCNLATYQEIIKYLEDEQGPSIVFHMAYEHFLHPSYHQSFLIVKSNEPSSKIRIEVHE